MRRSGSSCIGHGKVSLPQSVNWSKTKAYTTIRSTGNSFATPHMAGLCALILGKHGGLTPFQLKSVLYATATNAGGEA